MALGMAASPKPRNILGMKSDVTEIVIAIARTSALARFVTLNFL